MSETLPLAEVKARFSEVIDRVATTHDRVVVTRNVFSCRAKPYR